MPSTSLSNSESCPGPDPICAAWRDQLGEVLITREQIDQRVRELGAAISRDYAGRDPVLVGVLRGVFFFMSDLLRAIQVPALVDFIAISRYGPTERTRGVVRYTKDLDLPIEGRHVLFIEDVVDTGLTMGYILRTLQAREPASLNICALLDRPHSRLVDFDIAYVGFEIPDCWVVGYGMDYKEALRQLLGDGEGQRAGRGNHLGRNQEKVGVPVPARAAAPPARHQGAKNRLAGSRRRRNKIDRASTNLCFGQRLCFLTDLTFFLHVRLSTLVPGWLPLIAQGLLPACVLPGLPPFRTLMV